MALNKNISGIVLAGGMSRRLGRDKSVELVGGDPLIARVIGRLSKVSEEIVVVVNDLERASALPLYESAKVEIDIYPGKGSLGGIFTGLSAMSEDWGIVVACDMPFLNVELLRHMLSLRDGFDAVVPILARYPEPTHALYSRVCLPHIERRLKADDLKIANLLGDVRVRFVSEDEIDLLDLEHLSFFNVNTQQDLEHAQTLAAMGR